MVKLSVHKSRRHKGRLQVRHHSFINSAFDEDNCSASRPGSYTAGEWGPGTRIIGWAAESVWKFCKNIYIFCIWQDSNPRSLARGIITILTALFRMNETRIWKYSDGNTVVLEGEGENLPHWNYVHQSPTGTCLRSNPVLPFRRTGSQHRA